MSGDLDLDAVFGRSSPDDAFAAVLTEARMVLAEIASPLQAELWGSDILAALGGMRSPAAQAIVPAAERSGSPEALAILRVLGALGWPELRAEAAAAAGRLAAKGVPDPAWAAGLGTPEVRECWRYGDDRGLQEAVTLSFEYPAGCTWSRCCSITRSAAASRTSGSARPATCSPGPRPWRPRIPA